MLASQRGADSCDAPNLPQAGICHPCKPCPGYLYVTQLLKTLGARIIDLRMSVSRAESAGYKPSLEGCRGREQVSCV